MGDVGVKLKIMGQVDPSLDAALRKTQEQFDALQPDEKKAVVAPASSEIERQIRRELALRKVTFDEQMSQYQRALQAAKGNGDAELAILEKIKRVKEEQHRAEQEFGTLGAAGLTAVAVALGSIGAKSLEVAGNFEQFKAQLQTVQGTAAKASETFQNALEFAARTPFDVSGVVQATVQLEVYGQESKRVLPLVADLAAGMGKSIQDTSLVIGKAFSGSLEGFESLRNEYGISTSELARYGAEVSKTGGVLLQTNSQLAKAQNALERIIQTRFGGAVERQANTLKGAISNAGDSIDQLFAKIGETLVPAVTTAARGFSSFADLVGKVPPSLTQIAVLSGAAIAGISVMGGAALATTVALTALNAQLDSLGSRGVAGAARASGLLTRGLGLVSTAASSATSALAGFVATPIGLALTLAAAALASLKLQFAAVDAEAQRVGQAMADQSKEVLETSAKWRQYRAAVLEATQAQGLFTGGATGSHERLQAIKDALAAGDPSKIAAAFQAAGITVQELTKDAKAAKTEFLALGDSEKLLNRLFQAFDGQKGIQFQLTGPFAGLEKAIPDAEKVGDHYVATIDQVAAALDSVRQRRGTLREIFESADGAEKKVSPFLQALGEATSKARATDDALRFLTKLDSRSGLEQSLGVVNNELAQLSATAAKLNLPTDASGLSQRLLDASITPEERGFIDSYLGMLDRQETLQKKLDEDNKRAQKERVDALRESAQEQQDLEERQSQQQEAALKFRLANAKAGSEEEATLRKRLRDEKAQTIKQELADVADFEAQALAAAAGNAEEEKRIRQEVRTRRREILQQQLHDTQDLLAQEVQAGQELIQGARDKQDSSAAQVVESIDEVIGRLKAWGQANQQLIEQSPELASRYGAALDTLQKSRSQEQARIPTENLQFLKSAVDEIKTGAVGAEQELERVNRSIDLVNRVRRQGDVDAKGSEQLLNQLVRQRLSLEEQIAAKKRQDAQQIQSLELANKDADIQALEARKGAGEDVERQLAQARAERLKLALDAIEQERAAEVAAHGDAEAAAQKATLKQQALLKDESLRQFGELQKQVGQVQQAEDQKSAIRERAADRSNRLGGPQSPLQSFEEAFSGDSGFGVPQLGDARSRAKGLRDAGLGVFTPQVLRIPTTSQVLSRANRNLPPEVRDSLSGRGDAFGGASRGLQQASQVTHATFNIDGQFGRLSDPDVSRLVDRVIKKLGEQIDRHRRSRGPGAGETFRQ